MPFSPNKGSADFLKAQKKKSRCFEKDKQNRGSVSFLYMDDEKSFHISGCCGFAGISARRKIQVHYC